MHRIQIFLSLFLLLIGWGACTRSTESPRTEDPISEVVTGADSISIDFADLKIEAEHDRYNNGVKLSWQQGDKIKIYLEQQGRWDSLTYTVSGSDTFEGKSLRGVKIPKPETWSLDTPFSVYALVGDAYYQPQSSGPPLLVVSRNVSPLSDNIQDIVPYIVVSFSATGVTQNHVSVTPRHEGNLFTFEAYVGTQSTIDEIQIAESNMKNWVYAPNGTLSSKVNFIPTASPFLVDSDNRNFYYGWARTLGGTPSLEWKSTVTSRYKVSSTYSREIATELPKTSQIATLQSGKNYRLRFDIYKNIAHIVGNLTTTGTWTKDWMKTLDDNTPILDLLLPGTHDSGALSGGWMAQTQDQPIAEQLNRGIRALDIRVKSSDPNMVIYHGIISMGTTLRQVLTDVTGFLAANPSEFVVMLFKDENGSGDDTYKNLAKAHFNDPAFSPYMFIHPAGSSLPIRLKDVRGKILLITRNWVGTVSSNFSYGYDIRGFGSGSTMRPSSMSLSPPNYFVEVQDMYDNPADADKQAAIKSHLDNGERWYRNETWNFNYLSAATSNPFSSYTLYKRACKMNKYVLDWLQMVQLRRRGVIYMDYGASDEADSYGTPLVQEIIKNNFRLAR